MGLLSFFRTQERFLHIIGDSHVEPFSALSTSLPKNIQLKMCCVPGATASGLQNPHSKTLAGPIFKEYISQNVTNKDYVLIHLGEVDCGFLMWVKAEREGISINEQLKLTIKNYRLLLEQIRTKTKHCIVMSVIPPTIKDGTKIGNVANLRGQIKATQLQRTFITHEMNIALAKIAKELKFYFLNLEPILIDEKTKLVKEEYLNQNPEDHHLNPMNLIRLVLQELDKTGILK